MPTTIRSITSSRPLSRCEGLSMARKIQGCNVVRSDILIFKAPLDNRRCHSLPCFFRHVCILGHAYCRSKCTSCLKKVSLNPDILFFPFNKKTVGPLCPAATPVRYMVVDAASSRASAAAALHKHATARWATRYDNDNYGDGRRRRWRRRDGQRSRR